MKILHGGIFNVLLGFLRREISPRWREIILTQDFVLAIVISIVISCWGPQNLSHAAKALDFAVVIVSYGAIAIGFCIGGITISLTLPDSKFTERLASLSDQSKHGNAFSSLLFVFSWTAVVHWLAVVYMLFILLFYGKTDEALFVDVSWSHRAIIGAGAFICIYALLQFVITVLTLSQVGGLYIEKLKRQGAAK